MLAATPVTRTLAIRTVDITMGVVTDILTSGTAFTNTPAARLGYHDDCYLDGADDSGTYNDPSQLARVGVETQWVSSGAETCAVAKPYTDCPYALTNLALVHIAYRDNSYNLDVL